jgi:hypothetical protein
MSDPRVYSGFPTTPVPRDETPTSGVRYPAVAPPPPTPDAHVIRRLIDETKRLRRVVYVVAALVSLELVLLVVLLLRR